METNTINNSVDHIFNHIKKLSNADKTHCLLTTYGNIDCSEDELLRRSFKNRMNEQIDVKWVNLCEYTSSRITENTINNIIQMFIDKNPVDYWVCGNKSAWFDCELDNFHIHVDLYVRGLTGSYPMTLMNKPCAMFIRYEYLG